MTDFAIDAFLEVVRTGNITAAADRLYITQPALSRRIAALEDELGYPLLVRNRGVRTVELTTQGAAFIRIAEKWKQILAEARSLGHQDTSLPFTLSSVGSVSTYILSPVFDRFLQLNPLCRFVFHNYHSAEAYGYVESGQTDLAFISDDRYSKTVETIPAFREPMQLVTHALSISTAVVEPSHLDPEREIRLFWNPEYDQWHDFWFGPFARPRVLLDQMSLMEAFLSEPDTWLIAPRSAARKLETRPEISVHPLSHGPSDRIIYYLVKKNRENRFIPEFLKLLEEELSQTGISSFLSSSQPSER